jgi:hypothetical protein
MTPVFRPALPSARAAALGAVALLSLLAAPADAQRRDRDRTRERRTWVERCEDEGWDDSRIRHCETRALGMRAASGRPLRVDGGGNGGVDVLAWDRDSIDVQANIAVNARSEEDARAIAREIRIEVKDGAVTADGPANRRGASWWVNFEVRVPRATDLDVESSNGPLSVEGVRGKMELRTSNGPLTLTDLAGDVRGRTSNGPVSVRLSGPRWEGDGLDVSTSNGPVDLILPNEYAAHLVTGTVNGPIRVDFPVTVQGRIDRRIETDIGGGGKTVRVVTTNGPVVVRRR